MLTRNKIIKFIVENDGFYSAKLRNCTVNNKNWRSYCNRITQETAETNKHQIPKKYDEPTEEIKPPVLTAKRGREEQTPVNSKNVLTISHAPNDAISQFLYDGIDFFPVTKKITTTKSSDWTEHKIIFFDEQMCLFYQNQLRNINYEKKGFKFEDLQLNKDQDKKVEVVFEKIRKLTKNK